MTCGVYLLFHRKSGRYYIGQSIDVQRRRQEHKTAKNAGTYIDQAIQKYGWDEFDFQLILECRTDQLNKLETVFIKRFRALYPNGFNLTAGGDARGEISERTRKLLSDMQRRIQSLPANRRQQRDSNLKTWADPILRKQSAQRTTKQWQNPQSRQRILDGNRSQEARTKRAVATQRRWSTDEQFRQKMLEVLSNNRKRGGSHG